MIFNAGSTCQAVKWPPLPSLVHACTFRVVEVRMVLVGKPDNGGEMNLQLD